MRFFGLVSLCLPALLYPHISYGQASSSASDPETAAQWGLAAINAPKAYAAGFTGKGVRVGIFDSGINLRHPEFAGRVGTESVDIDSSIWSGQMNPVVGDRGVYGTFVSGIVAANRDGTGMHGVAYDATLVPTSATLAYSNFDPFTSFAMRYFARQGVEIVNAPLVIYDGTISTAGGAASIEKSLPGIVGGLREAARAGVVSVWSAGDYLGRGAQLPARLPHYFPELESTMLAVAALDRQGKLISNASACGVAAQWCLAAPGGDPASPASDAIHSTSPYGGYGTLAGASFAAPHVTGALAVAREIFPDADIRDVRKLILQTATDIGAAGVDAVYGWGALNLGNVVDAIAPSGRRIFADAAWGRSVAMGQVARAPFATATVRSTPSSPVWVSASALTAGIGSSSDPTQARTTSKALVAGVDLIDADSFTAGLGIGYTALDTRALQLANRASADGFHAFGYGRWEGAGWYARSSAGVSYFSQEHTRRHIPGLAGTALALQAPVATSRRAVWGAFADAEAGRRVDLGLLEAAVFARLTGTAEQAGRAGESGAGIFGYALQADGSATASAGPGIRLSAAYRLGSWQIVPELEFSYARVLGSDRFTADTALLNRTMEASTVPLGRDIFNVGAKLDFRLPDSGLVASVGYSGAFRKAAEQHKVQVGLSFRF